MFIDGKKIAKEILDNLKAEVANLPFRPVFCDVLVGSDPVSLSYVKIKGKTAETIGLSFRLEQLPADISEKDLKQKIAELNEAPELCGLIIQLPLPKEIDRQAALNVISPELDVDCLGNVNTEHFYAAGEGLIPPTAAAIMKIVESLPASLRTGQFVIVGQGHLVGKPVSALLKKRGYQVIVADRKTQDLSAVTKAADVLICGTGQPGLITKEFVKPGAAVIDAGTAEIDGGIVGDVDVESINEIAGFITPVPGGVGPVTVSMLLYNVVAVAKGRVK